MNRYFTTPIFRSDIPHSHEYAMLLVCLPAAQANDLLAAAEEMRKFAAFYPRLSSMRFSIATAPRTPVTIAPWRSPLHEIHSRHCEGGTSLWLPAGFNPYAIDMVTPTTATVVIARAPPVAQLLLLFEVSDMGDKYHTTELPIDLLEQAAGVRLMPAFPPKQSKPQEDSSHAPLRRS